MSEVETEMLAILIIVYIVGIVCFVASWLKGSKYTSTQEPKPLQNKNKTYKDP